MNDGFADDPFGVVSRDWRRVLLDDPCVYCGRPPVVLDHITPSLSGGRDGWENRAPCCERCDKWKQAASPLIFLMALRIAERVTERRAKRYISPNTKMHAYNSIVGQFCRKPWASKRSKRSLRRPL